MSWVRFFFCFSFCLYFRGGVSFLLLCSFGAISVSLTGFWRVWGFAGFWGSEPDFLFGTRRFREPTQSPLSRARYFLSSRRGRMCGAVCRLGCAYTPWLVTAARCEGGHVNSRRPLSCLGCIVLPPPPTGLRLGCDWAGVKAKADVSRCKNVAATWVR